MGRGSWGAKPNPTNPNFQLQKVFDIADDYNMMYTKII